MAECISRTYDSLGRPSGLAVGPPLVGAPYSIQYGFDSLGRFSSVSSSVQSVSSVVNYSYLPNSDLISEISNLPSEIHTTKSYESNRDLITSVENRYSANVISKYEYQNDPLGRRIQRIDQGDSGIPACVTNIFSYNSRSELTNALMPAMSNVEVDERLFAYQYDPIGNRETSAHSTGSGQATNGATLTYTANELNQYTSVTSVQSVVNYSHDPDGNLTNDGAFVYT